MDSFEPINTYEEYKKRAQEDFNKWLPERLERVEKKYADYDELKKKAASADSLQEQIDAMKAENSGLQTKLEDMKTAHEADLAAAKRETVKL